MFYSTSAIDRSVDAIDHLAYTWNMMIVLVTRLKLSIFAVKHRYLDEVKSTTELLAQD